MPHFSLTNQAGQASPEVAVVSNCDSPVWVMVDVIGSSRSAEDPVDAVPFLRFQPAFNAANTYSAAAYNNSSRANGLDFEIDLEQGSPIFLPVPGSLTAGIPAMANSATVLFEAVSFVAKEGDQPRKPLKRTTIVRQGLTSGGILIPRGATHVTVIGPAALGALRCTGNNMGENIPFDIIPNTRTVLPGVRGLAIAPVPDDLFLVWEILLQ